MLRADDLLSFLLHFPRRIRKWSSLSSALSLLNLGEFSQGGFHLANI